MSSMYLYWAFQSSEEFSALDTSFMAISFFAGSSSPAARSDGAAEACAGRSSGTAAKDAPASRSVRREGVAVGRDSPGECSTRAPIGLWGVGVVSGGALIGRFPIRGGAGLDTCARQV